MRVTGPVTAALVSIALAATACSAIRSDVGATQTTTTASASPSGLGSTAATSTSTGATSGRPQTTTPAADPAPARARAVLAGLSLAQRAGQLVMLGSPAAQASATTATAITSAHVGNVMLTGRSATGTAATRAVVHSLATRATSAATGGVDLLVATDQEGGKVQVLRGNGFSAIPSGLVQGSWTTSTLRRQAARWGAQLRAAGVRLDLAPVTDTVPTASADDNAPVGAFDRQYGSDPAAVGRHAVAFTHGMADAGVLTSPKHFPGLGHVRDNTDTTRGVTDFVTTVGSADVDAFAATVRAGVQVVMVSSAVYSRIDPDQPACFSRTVVTGLLRGRLGFDGVVISDDLGRARAVTGVSAGTRAVRFVAAGGDLVLTVVPSTGEDMARAIARRAASDPAFRAKVDAAVLRVLTLKARSGLLDRAGQ